MKILVWRSAWRGSKRGICEILSRSKPCPWTTEGRSNMKYAVKTNLSHVLLPFPCLFILPDKTKREKETWWIYSGLLIFFDYFKVTFTLFSNFSTLFARCEAKTRIWQRVYTERIRREQVVTVPTFRHVQNSLATSFRLSINEYSARIDFFLLSLSFQLEANATTVEFDRDTRKKLLCAGQFARKNAA